MRAPRSSLGKSAALKTTSAPPIRLIETESDIVEGIAALTSTCRYMKRAHTAAGAPPLRRNIGGFPGLARIIVGQQVSIQAAASIWAKVETGLGQVTPDAILARSDDDLRSLGLSRPKVKTLRAMSTAATEGVLPFKRFTTMSEEDIRTRLTSVSGIGPWTADIYLMFCLGRADQFAPGDLALQIAVGMLMNKPERPTADDIEALARKRWSPWRGVAARMLWHYYAHIKAQEKAASPV